MGQAPSVPVEHARLIFTRSSLSNNTIQCDALGIHYQLSTPREWKTTRITTVSRWDARQGKDVPVAEWQKKNIGSDRVRFASNCPSIVDGTESEDGFIPIDSFFPRTGGFVGSAYLQRSFTVNGVTYTWKARVDGDALYRGDEDVPVATLSGRRWFVNRRMPYIAVAPGCEDILDQVLVTCLYIEQKRREVKEGDDS